MFQEYSRSRKKLPFCLGGGGTRLFSGGNRIQNLEVKQKTNILYKEM